ncbi:MAG: carboxypeptidase regulatory-like domain-containing protein [Syntrophales bacterium]
MSAYGTGYLSEYYDNVTDSSSATPVTVTAGQTTPNINFGLAELGKITGKVTRESDGSPVAGVWIAAENYSTGAYGGGGCGKSNPDGSYTISGLSSGDYRLEANTGGTDYALKYFNNALSFAAASKVNVTISQTVNADFRLLSLPAFRGDINGDGKIDLADAILAIGLPAGVISEAMVYKSGDVNGNGKIGTEEAVYDMQGISQVREMPLHVPLKIDGILASGEWDDAKTAEITVEEGWVVKVLYKNDVDNLYVAFTNLKPQSGELYPEIRLDVNNDKSSSWKSDDWWFHTSYNNCEMRGGYNIWSTCERAKLGWSGNIFPLTTPGTVEIRIEYEKLGLVSGEARDIGVAFDVTDTRTKWKFWPSSVSTSNPSTWGTWHIE